MEFKWSTGIPFERSKRLKRGDPIVVEHEKEQAAYTSSLNHDENTWEILNQSSFNNGFKSSNKREELDNKISDRSLVQQRGFNPFLHDNTYVEDISISDKFLKPVNTTTEREKTC